MREKEKEKCEKVKGNRVFIPLSVLVRVGACLSMDPIPPGPLISIRWPTMHLPVIRLGPSD